MRSIVLKIIGRANVRKLQILASVRSSQREFYRAILRTRRNNIRDYDPRLDLVFGGGCAWCRGGSHEHPDKDHITPHRKTRDDKFDNIWHLCSTCNQRRKDLVASFLGESALFNMRSLWFWWAEERQKIIDLVKEKSFDSIASHLNMPEYKEFVIHCAAYEDICRFFTYEVLNKCAHNKSDDCRMAMAHVRCYLAILYDRCKELDDSESNLRNAIFTVKQLTGLINYPLAIYARTQLAHLLIKRRTQTAIKEARNLLDGGQGANLIGEETVLNKMQFYCQSHDPEAAIETSRQHKSFLSLRSNVIASEILAASYMELAKRGVPDADDAACAYDKLSFHLALQERNPRTILLRALNLVRSLEHNYPEHAAEALLFAKAFSFANIGLEREHADRLAPGGYNVSEAVKRWERKHRALRRSHDRFKYLFGLKESCPVISIV